MKKNYILSAIALCACLLSACNKEMDTPQNEGSEENKEGVITYIRATGNENESKGSIDGTSGDFSWNVGDQIAVWDNTVDEYNVSAELTIDYFSGDNATFSFTGLGERGNYAVSPAWIRVADAPTSVTLPGTYTLSQVAGEKSPVPMIAVNNESTLHFKQLGALLRITLNNLPPSTRSVTIDFNGKKVQGIFAVSNPGTATPSIATSAIEEADNHDIITINTGDLGGWTDDLDVNIPVPTGTYTTITVKAWDAADGEGKTEETRTIPTLQMTRWIKVTAGVSSDWKPIRTSARKVIASLPAFSIDAENRVAFAPGNLIVNSGVYSFHTNQYDCTFGLVNASSGQLTGATDEDRATDLRSRADRDLFQWAEMTGGTSGNSISFGTIAGHNDWKLCSSFIYLLGSREGSIFVKCRLPYTEGFPDMTKMKNYKTFNSPNETWGGTNGVFIFPDNWDESLNVASFAVNTAYRPFTTANIAEGITKTVYDQLIAAGAAFIPSNATYSPVEDTIFWYIGEVGGSWTCTKGDTETTAYAWYFLGASFASNQKVGNTQWRTVRLVRDLN